MQRLRLQRGPYDSTWRAAARTGAGLGAYAARYARSVRETFDADRNSGLLEAVLAERLGRALKGNRRYKAPWRAATSTVRVALTGALSHLTRLVGAGTEKRGDGPMKAVVAGRVGRVAGPRRLGRAVGAIAARMRRQPRALAWAGAVVGLLALAGGLRVVELDRIGFNSDEAVYSGQAAALIGDADLSQFFSVFRAHPLLFQLTLGGLFGLVGVSDIAARVFVALTFGVGSVGLTYLLASRLYGRRIGIVAAVIMTVLPYHVLVSRQVLLDSPFAFFVLLALWLTARGLEDRSGRWLIWTALAAGLATATKEVGVLLVPVLAGFVLSTGRWREIPKRRFLLAAALFTVIVAPYPLSRLLMDTTGGGGSSYVLWQLSRPPNHSPDYFLQVLIGFGGTAFVALVALGFLGLATRLRQGRNMLLLLWIVVFLGFFQVWPTKLFPYLMPVIPALSICAALAIDGGAKWIAERARALWRLSPPVAPGLAGVAVVALALYLGSASLSMARNGPDMLGQPFQFDVEVQDFAGGREFGLWAKENTPEDARFLTIGPSMGNVLRFYGHRDSVALSVSLDPKRRNPAYVPVPNPDLWFRESGLHYIVWDFYSADRSAFYNARLMRYARKYGGSIVFAYYETADGEFVASSAVPPEGAEPRLIVYDAIGGDPVRDFTPLKPLAEAEAADTLSLDVSLRTDNAGAAGEQ